MKRTELQAKLNSILIGLSTYNLYNLAKVVMENLETLGLDNSQGYYSVDIYNFSLIIKYKRRSLVSFDIKRKKAETQTQWVGVAYVVKEVVVDKDFIDFETAEKKIHDDYLKESQSDYRFYPLDKEREAFKVLKDHFPTLKASELKDLLGNLGGHDFWLVEDLENEGK